MPSSTVVTLTSGRYSAGQNSGKQVLKELHIFSAPNDCISQHNRCNHEKNVISRDDLRSQFGNAIRGMRQCLTGATIEYLSLGGRYFDISSKARSSIPSSNPAQLQYGIEGRKWGEDPFFAPSSQALRILVRIDAEITAETIGKHTVGWIYEEVNKAQSLIKKFLVDMNILEDGVKDMEDSERTQIFEQWVKSRVQARAVGREGRGFPDAEKEARRMGRPKKAREALHDAHRREIPRMAFEQAKFEKWQRRVEGVERMDV